VDAVVAPAILVTQFAVEDLSVGADEREVDAAGGGV
jgi:hypothetical protein